MWLRSVHIYNRTGSRRHLVRLLLCETSAWPWRSPLLQNNRANAVIAQMLSPSSFSSCILPASSAPVLVPVMQSQFPNHHLRTLPNPSRTWHRAWCVRYQTFFRRPKIYSRPARILWPAIRPKLSWTPSICSARRQSRLNQCNRKSRPTSNRWISFWWRERKTIRFRCARRTIYGIITHSMRVARLPFWWPAGRQTLTNRTMHYRWSTTHTCAGAASILW